MNAVTTQEGGALSAPRQQFDLSPQNFDQALTFSNYLADSDMVPKDFKGKPGNCLIAIQWGAELGLKPLQALQNLAIINGRPSLWGDAVIALVRSSPVCEWVIEDDNGDTATCRVKRRGEPEQSRTFSMVDAKAAGLAGKPGPWTQYPKRMRQMRARAFALRDVFPDVLRGLPVAEEVMDAPTERHMGPVERVEPETQTPPAFPADRFAKNLPAWRAAIAEGKATADTVIKKAATVGALTQEQIAAIRAPIEQPVTDVQPKGEGPVVTFAQVSAALQDAKEADALNVAADLINQVASPQHQAELNALYEQRMDELSQ